MLPNFQITRRKPLSKQAQKAGIFDFHALVDYVHQLPYGRISDKRQLGLSFIEKCGTCSSKHALLRAIALEQKINSIQLILGIYKMNAQNTPPVGAVLQEYNLPYLPEGHNYLYYENTRYDVTFADKARVNDWIEADLLQEQQLFPHQIDVFKLHIHQAFLKKWLLETKLPYSLDEIWAIREKCIDALIV